MNKVLDDFTRDASMSEDRIAGEKGFQDKTLFITGATGFLGKVYIEKVLRTCPLVKKIYVLVRAKKDKDPHLRMKDIFEGPLYNLLRKERGSDIFKKVVAISGDMIDIGLGISQEDRELLRSEVQIIYHSAATVRFDETIKRAVLINTRGTKFMLDLAKECKNLLAFTYISTAYCHPHEKTLYEKIYPPPADPDTVINTIEWLEDLDDLKDKILGTYPNTYSFTKALAEDLVAQQFNNLPVIIIRPSVVLPIWKDPLPGWTDNMNGPLGLMIAGGKGVIRSMYGDPKASVDFVPVDLVINLSLFATFYFVNFGKMRIYNCTASSKDKRTWEFALGLAKKISDTKLPFNGVMWYPGGSLTQSRIKHYMIVLFFQYLPAVLLDPIIFLSGNKPVLCRVQKKITKSYEVLEYYANNQWEFNNEEAVKVRSLVTEHEKNIYKLDDEGADYEDYFYKCMHSARLHILHEPDSTIPSAKRHMKIMWAVDQIARLIFYIGFTYLIYTHVISPIFGI